MQNPYLPERLWAQLEGRLWHATDLAGLEGIVRDGCIRVSTAARYKNSFCRQRGCVSMFEFGPGSRDQSEFEASNWAGWFGNQLEGLSVIWIEIDRSQVAGQLTPPNRVSELWNLGDVSQRFFTGVEACHAGPVPLDAAKGALFVDKAKLSRHRYVSAPIGTGISDAVLNFDAEQRT